MNNHASLLGLSDRELLLHAGDATHQHYKGGLYKLLGPVRDIRTGGSLLDLDGQPMIAYLHCFPHARDIWVRSEAEFNGTVKSPTDGSQLRRFRPLNRSGS
jgi:hypothetical protein